MERRSSDGGFKSNISLGGHASRFEPPKPMADLAIKVAKTLKLDIAGVDILFDTTGYRICEANSSPGFQALEKACGIDVPNALFKAMAAKYGLSRRAKGSRKPSREKWQQFASKFAVRLSQG